MEDIIDVKIQVHKCNIVDSKYPKPVGHNKCLHMQISIDGIMYVVFTISIALMRVIDQIPANDYPFETTITKEDNRYYKFN